MCSASFKVLFLALILCLPLKAENPQSNDGGPFPINVRINPLSILLGVIHADMDFRVANRVTFGPALGFASRTSSSVIATGLNLGVRANFYLTGDAISDSWYVSSSAGVLFLTSKSGASEARSNALNLGFTAGYQWVFASGFNVMLGLGAVYYAIDKKQTATDGSVISVPSYSGTLPRLDFTVGFAL